MLPDAGGTTLIHEPEMDGWVRRKHGGPPSPGGRAALQPGVAVAVCTYKRAAALTRFLDSLAAQDRVPEEVVIVDASTDDETEQSIAARTRRQALADCIVYLRVRGGRRGLTRQRNTALQFVTRDLVAFFDDDIVLQPHCLSELERVHRSLGDSVVGVGAMIENASASPSALWKLRRLLGIVADLRPGSYQRSGMSVPWAFLDRSAGVMRGDYLPGGAVMWKTEMARAGGFDEQLTGYGQGEDLEFSLRARACGDLVMSTSARLLHLHEETGRPDHFGLGYMAIHNRYRIHRSRLENRRLRDVLWFTYAWSIDTFFLLRQLVVPGRSRDVMKQIAGRLAAAADLIAGRHVPHDRRPGPNHFV